MSEQVEAWLFRLQRISALVLAPLVLAHLAIMFHAVHGGLDAHEILGRTRGSVGFGLFYGVFVLAASVHAPIGLRNLLRDLTPCTPPVALGLAAAFGVLLLVLGMRAVVGVVA